MSLETTTKINRLLMNSTPGGLMFSDWLLANGYSAQLVKRYRESGWLEMLSPGVTYRKNDKLSALAAVSSFNSQMKRGLRVAAASALELIGFSHYVQIGKPQLVMALDTSTVPNWMRHDVFDMVFVPFYTEIFPEIKSLEIERNGTTVLASSPELAFMECLHLVPKRYNYMDLYYIMEQLTALDASSVQTLLETVKSQRIKRMFLYMAEKAGHYWFELLDMAKMGLTSSKLQLVPGGVYNAKYQITIPKELNDYE